MNTSSEMSYYLSTNMSPPGDASIFSDRHHHGIALWRRQGDTIELARMWELERISGQKNHYWPVYGEEQLERLLTHLLGAEGLTTADIQSSWGTPGLPKYQPPQVPAGAESFAIHSLAHLFSGLLLDSRIFKEETILAMALDHGPDLLQETRVPEHFYAGCVADKGRLSFLPMRSPAPLYTVAEAVFGKEPGTLMALAGATTTKIALDAERLVSNAELYGGRTNPLIAANHIVQAIISEAKRQLATAQTDSNFSAEENFQSAVMKIVQRCCDAISVRNVELLVAHGAVRPEECYLSTSGGYALNCPTNTLLMDRFGFRGLLTPPCANDSGQALGLGLLGLYCAGEFADADIRIDSASRGSEITDLDQALEAFAPWIESVSDFTPEEFAADLQDDVLVWVDGAAEMGPRALGNRSILGDPRSSATKDRLNECKQRQWWRPVAPIVLSDQVGEWFVQDRPSPYMLEAVEVRPENAGRVPAVVHLDGSARHQVLTPEVNPLLHRAISAFFAATGVPIICNTSLNDKAEPIVNTAAEALNFAVRKGIGVAYITSKRIRLRSEPVPKVEAPRGPHPRRTEFFEGQEPIRDKVWDSWRARGYTDAAIILMLLEPELRPELGEAYPALVNELAELAMEKPEVAALAKSHLATSGPHAVFNINAKLPAGAG